MEAVLPPPQPFHFINSLENITSGNLSKEWQKWRDSFLIYYAACELGTKAEKVQVSILLHIIGEQCREVYSQFEEKVEKLQDLLNKFDSFFLPKKNLTIERHKFFNRNQGQGESIEQYAYELKKLASSCEFKDLNEDLIRDKLVCGIRDDMLRERLLREPDLTLKKAVEISNLAQISKMQACTIKSESTEHQAYTINACHDRYNNFEDVGSSHNQVDWVSRARGGSNSHRGGWRGGGRARPPAVSRSAVSAPQQRRQAPGHPMMMPSRSVKQVPPVLHGGYEQRLACNMCGLYHHYNAKCAALGKRCLKCNNFNHFSRMCEVNHLRADESADQVIYYFSGSLSDWSIDLVFGKSVLKFKLDTGADVNVIPRRYLKQAGIDEIHLSESSVKLRGYSGRDIKVLGKCNLKVLYKQNEYILEFIVADVASPPILGRDSCCELNVIKLTLAVTSTSESSYSYITNEYSDVFEGIGCMPGEYKIEIDSSITPVVHAPRKVPVALRDSIKQKLDAMVNEGIIAKVEGPTDWVNSITVARKANGELRICLDPRDLNRAIKREHFKLPTLDEITVNLRGSKYFSTLDAKQGFWQLRLHKDSTHLCTFNTVFGRYKFLRLPFGITSASEVFHKKMYEHFDDIYGVCLFVDDLLIHGRTKQEHDDRLRQVLDRCRDINLKLNVNKCKFGLTEIKYLGHKISANGICPDGSHTSAIRNMPRPQNVKDLERFLGLVNYVGSFIPNLSDKNYVLRLLLKKDVEWHWTEIHQKAFENLKNHLITAPILQFYTLNKPVVISVDACKNGLGACLLQNNLPVCYASRSLTKAEQAYAQIEKELLAVVYACEKFYTYIYGRGDITVETDHKPLVSIINKPIATAPARLQRMLMRLQPYAFKLVYKPGKYLYLADALSRAVQPVSEPPAEPRDQLDARAQVCAVAVGNPIIDTHFIRIQKETQSDSELQALTKYVRNGWPTHKLEVPSEVRPYWAFRDELFLAYGLLWKSDRIVIPSSMRKEMLRCVHIGHLGIEKCKLRVRESMFWPNINTQLEDYISNCQACLTFKNENRKETLIPHDVPSRAWSKIGVDVFHFNGEKYLIGVDYYSKYVEIAKLNTLTSEAIILELKNIFSRHGIPDIVMSDNGPEFKSYKFQNFSTQWCFQHVTSSPLYAQSNGQVERTIQTMKNMLKKTSEQKSEFRLALLEYLNTPISHKLASPSELLNNRKLRSIIPCSPKLLLPKIQKDVIRELQSRKNKQKLYYDKNARDMPTLHVNQKVKVRIDKRWVSGTIQSVRGPRSYVVKICEGGTLIRNRRHLIVDSERRPDYTAKGPVCFMPYDDISTRSNNTMTSPSPGGAPRAAIEIDSRAASGSASNTGTNSYVTRSGRVVIAPDRWGF